MPVQALLEDEPDKYQSHFSEYIKRGVEADNIEEMYKKVHAAIRADPIKKKSEKQPPKEHKRWDNLFESPYIPLVFVQLIMFYQVIFLMS